MNITFLYTDYNYTNEGKYYIGIGSLSSFLKQHGHKTNLIHVKYPISKKKLIQKVEKLNPDLIAVSTLTTTFKDILSYTKQIKQHFDIPIVCGGIHPTLSPIETLKQNVFDYVCVGEGEFPLLELVNNLENNERTDNIQSIWTMKNNTIISNPTRPLIENLDILPFPDREIFDFENLAGVKYYNRAVFMASRGCHYNCSYCCNHAIKKNYPNHAKYLRFRSVTNVIKEIKEVLNNYPQIQHIRFNDDSLTTIDSWFYEFAEKYKKEINLPFTCMGRINELNEDKIKLLSDIKCKKVEVGIETGNPEFRAKVLHRYFTNDQIINIIKKIREYKILVTGFNMTGLPNETLNYFLDTVKLNALANPSMTTIFYFTPFPKTDLYALAYNNNMLNKEKVSDETSFYEESIINQKGYPYPQVKFAVHYFPILIKIYKLLFKNHNEKAIKKFDNLLLHKKFSYTFFNSIYYLLFFYKPLIILIFYKFPKLYAFIVFIVRSWKNKFLRKRIS